MLVPISFVSFQAWFLPACVLSSSTQITKLMYDKQTNKNFCKSFASAKDAGTALIDSFIMRKNTAHKHIVKDFLLSLVAMPIKDYMV